MTDSPFFLKPGAVELESAVDVGVPSHYGNLSAELLAFENGLAIADLGNLCVVTVAGSDRLSWLNSLSSQSLIGLAVGLSIETLFLDANGRIEGAARIVDDGEACWLIIDPASAQPLVEWLRRMVFMLKVEIVVHEDLSVIAHWGSFWPDSVAAVSGFGNMPIVWFDPWSSVVPGGFQYHDGAEHSGANYRLALAVVTDSERGRLAVSDLPVAGSLALEALRIAAWRPRFQNEVDEKSLPHELDWLRTSVHLNKGCYRGQETIAKVHNLGHPPRRLVFLHLDGSDSVLPLPGDEVLLDEVVIGRVTSAAFHAELGPIALAVIKRVTSHEATLIVASGDTLIAAAQEIVVPRDAGRVADIPRLPRLGSTGA